MQRKEPIQQTIDPSLYYDDNGSCDSIRKMKRRHNHHILNGGQQLDSMVANWVPSRDCLLPPSRDVPQHIANGVTIQDHDSRNKARKKPHTERSSRYKKSKKSDTHDKKKPKKRKDERNNEHDDHHQVAQESQRSKERRKHKQRAIPESLVGREVSWKTSSYSSLNDDQDLPLLHEDFIKSKTRQLGRHSHRQKSKDQTVEEAQQAMERIVLDVNGFPIEAGDDDSVQSLDIRDIAAATTKTLKFNNDSFTSTEMTRTGSLFQDSLTSVERTFADSSLQRHMHESINSKEENSSGVPVSVHHDASTSAEMAVSPPFSKTKVNTSDCPHEDKSLSRKRRIPRHLRREMVKIHTAAAFEAFLRRQHHETINEKCDDSGDSFQSWSSVKDDDKVSTTSSSASDGDDLDDDDDPFKHCRAITCRGSESSLLPASCDDADVRSFQEIDSGGNNNHRPSFGRVRRNESFVKRVSARDLLKSSAAAG